jgi:hypothetical protein
LSAFFCNFDFHKSQTMRLLFLFIVFSVTISSTNAQSIQIKDQITQEAIPFAKVYFSNTSSVISDIDGYFTVNLNDTIKKISIKFHGYKDTTYLFNQVRTSQVLYLNPLQINLQDVVVKPGENPAHRIIDLVIENRKKNNPIGNYAFQYEAYSKYHFTIDPEVISSLPENSTDSSINQLKSFFTNQYLFLLETRSERKFLPPARDNETILAYKTSGFSDPLFSTFARELQSFSFYENQIEILGKKYINPIALGGTKRYLFILEDTTLVGKDTVYTISFRPRKGKNFEAMKGFLYINTNGFAIDKVIAEPVEKESDISVKIVQEYAFVNEKYWFPNKLSSELTFGSFEIGEKKNVQIIGKGSSYIENPQLGIELSKRNFNDLLVNTTEKAGDLSDEDWKNQRRYELSEQENNTYRALDSISKKYNLDAKLKLVKILSEGKLPFGYLQMDLNRLLEYNLYEGYRLGTGLETSSKFSNRFHVGSYFAYGTSDKAWKYGAYSEVKILPKKELIFRVNYKNDVTKRGFTQFNSTARALSAESFLNNLYVLDYEKQEVLEGILSMYVKPNLHVLLASDYQRIGFTNGYLFTSQSAQLSNLELVTSSIEFNWQFREKVMMLGNKRISVGSKFPRVQAKFLTSIPSLSQHSTNFQRFSMDVSQQIQVFASGRFSWKLQAGKTWGNAPLLFQHIAPGTGKNFWVSTPNSFEAILPSTFFGEEQISLFNRYRFKAIKTSLKWFNPQFSLHHALGYGRFTHKLSHSNQFQSMEKGYTECGIIVDRILVSGFTGLGLGIFMPYGNYALPKMEDNLVFKLALSIDIK